mmetsp:Transcript_61494/g.148016  ORF Transcript_61494/g.148016 Transcript_61494/m.148016 type:complete len:93 (+) Transcript_61494:204-482(+)
MASVEGRVAAISLYRTLLRAAHLIPQDNKRMFALDRIREGFRESKGETDEEKIRQMFLLGYTQLESIEVQTEHLSNLTSFISAQSGGSTEAK